MLHEKKVKGKLKKGEKAKGKRHESRHLRVYLPLPFSFTFCLLTVAFF